MWPDSIADTTRWSLPPAKEIQIASRNGKGMDKNCPRAQNAKVLKLLNLRSGLCIGTLGRVNDERPSGRCHPESFGQTGTEAQRVRPLEFSDYPYRESAFKSSTFVRVMMSDRGNAAQQIFDSTPNQPHEHRYRKMFTYGRVTGAMNIACPFGGI